MGAWDATSFGNDAANDWAHDLEESDDLSVIEEALQAILDLGDGDLGTGDSERAIAAAEVVAWLLGRPSELTAFTAVGSAGSRHIPSSHCLPLEKRHRPRSLGSNAHPHRFSIFGMENPDGSPPWAICGRGSLASAGP